MNAQTRQTIKDAALQPSVLRAALKYAELGLSVIPVRGKICPLDWERNQGKRAGEKDITYWYYQQLLEGVAIVCGAVSGNLVVLDFDGLDCAGEFQQVFPQLTGTYVVKSGSGNGAHFYYYVDDLPPTTRTKGYELRADGHYVVAPPSPHPSGNRYTVYGQHEIMRVAHLDNVVAWIRAKKAAKGFINTNEPIGRFRDMPTTGDDPFSFNPRHPGRQMPRTEYLRLAWLANAVQSELGFIRSRAEGERNEALFRSAIVLSQLVAGGELDEARTRQNLMDAARDVGTPEDEAQRTISSGFERGLKEPRRVKRS